MKRIQVNSNEMQLLFICKKIDLFATLIDHCSITERLVITDYGNLQYAVDEELLQQQRQHYHHIRNYADFMACNLALIKQVQLMLKQNEKFLTIGGDHAIGFGMSSNQFKCVFSLIVVVVVVVGGGWVQVPWRVTCSTRPICRWCGSMRMRTSICTIPRSRATFTACPSRFCCNSCAAPGNIRASIRQRLIGEFNDLLSIYLRIFINLAFIDYRSVVFSLFAHTLSSHSHFHRVIVSAIIIASLLSLSVTAYS